jgi:hypothetical protein
MAADKEQRLLRNARRESLLIMTVWLAALVWSVSVGYFAGSPRDGSELSLVLGMPAWVFWGVVLPWAICLLFSVWFCFGFIADDDLGRDPEPGDGHE